MESKLEDIEARHRKERKDLQNEITALKHSVNKTDKKGKKTVTAKIAVLEAELDARHEQELGEFNKANSSHTTNEPEINGTSQGDVAALSDEVSNLSTTGAPSQQRVTKAQKRRDKKTQAAKEREVEIAAGEEMAKTGARQVEMDRFKDLLSSLNLELHEISADGDCLFNAVAHQFSSCPSAQDEGTPLSLSGKDVRARSVSFMRQNAERFLPYLVDEQTGDMLKAAEFDEYCEKMSRAGVWGGEPEIQALSEALQRPVKVLQTDVPPLLINEHFRGKPLVITFHKHVLQLGSHYNSTKPVEVTHSPS